MGMWVVSMALDFYRGQKQDQAAKDVCKGLASIEEELYLWRAKVVAGAGGVGPAASEALRETAVEMAGEPSSVLSVEAPSAFLPFPGIERVA
jgi:hypothetical protein